MVFNRNTRFRVYGALLAGGTVLLFLGGPDYYASRSFRHVWDTGHILYFALLAALLSSRGPVSRMSTAWQWVAILALTLLLGVAIELLQQGSARTPDTGDVLRDFNGSLLVLVFGAPGAKLQPRGWRLSLRVFAVLLTLLQLWPLGRSVVDEALARQQFPLLSGFETAFEIDRWAGSAGLSVERDATVSAGRFLRLQLTTDPYSGAELRYFEGNWAAARAMRIDLYNPAADPLRVTARIHDLQHADGEQEYEDRFNRSFLLQHGWNSIEINLDEVETGPAGRRMDMSRIRGLGIFVASLPSPRTLYIDEVRLVY